MPKLFCRIAQGPICTPPGTGLLRLAGLLGVKSTRDIDRVRALVARAALDSGDRVSACDILSAAVLRRPPRRPRAVVPKEAGAAGGSDSARLAHDEDEADAFAPDLCEALDLVVAKVDGRGEEAGGTRE